MMNRDRVSLIDSSDRLGRCAMSTVPPVCRGARYMTPPLCGPRGPRPAEWRAAGPPQGRGRCPRGEPGRALLGVELDDQLLLHRRVDDLPGGERVDENLHLAGDDLQPCRHGLAADLGVSHHERGQLPRLLPDLHDVVLADPGGRDVHLLAVDRDVAVLDQLASHVAGLGEAGPVDHVVQPRLEDLQQGLTGLAALAVGFLVVAPELLLEYAVHPAGLLLLTELQQVLGLLEPSAAVLAGRVRALLDRALRPVALGALQEQLHLLPTATTAVRTCVASHLSLPPQTRRRFGGRQPLCGCGVTSLIEPTSRPAACSERIAVSRPEPGPLTKTSTLRMPCSMARRAAASAASWAANGVDSREPLKPTWPDDAHEITLPVGSVIDTIVLLNVLLM